MQQLFHWVRSRLEEPSAAPRYLQLAMLLEQGINQNKGLLGQFLPAERLIAQQLALSRVTVSRSLALLEEKGLIVRQQGVGTRISQHLHYSLDHNESGFTTLVLQTGGVAGNRWLERTTMLLPDTVAANVPILRDETVTKLRRVRLINGEPASLETTWIPLGLLPEPERLEHSLYQYWAAQGIYPARKQVRIKAVACQSDVAGHLNIQPGMPLLFYRQHTYNAQRTLLEYCEIYCRSDIYEIQVSD